MNQRDFLRRNFSILSVLIIPICVAINFVGGQVATILKLPVYLDAIGTMLAAMLCGPVIGASAGALTTLIMSLTNPTNFPFIFVSVLTGTVMGLLVKFRMLTSWWKWIISMVILSLTAIITSAPIVVWLYGGVTGGGSSVITAFAMMAGANIWTAVFGVEGFFTFIDRILSFIICLIAVRTLPPRVLVMFRYGEILIKRQD